MKKEQENWQNRHVLIAGMAKSGVASADLLLEQGAYVILSDTKSPNALPDIVQKYEPFVKQGKAAFALGELPTLYYDDIDMMVISPVISLYAPFVQEAVEKGIEVIGEIELGYRCAKAPIVAITGTNGKTTTTALTGALFQAAGKNTFILGNIGVPLTSMATETTKDDVIVAEVAALQLESIVEFHSPCCTILNISEDHLDRFGTMEHYIGSKEILLKNQTSDDLLVLNAEDSTVLKMGEKSKAQKLHFSIKKPVERGAFVDDGNIVYKDEKHEIVVCPVSDLKIIGSHNVENALAAVCLALSQGLDAKAVASGLRNFMGVEHRIELIIEKDGVRYYNDSKATNPDSAIKAIEAMDRPTVLLLGGSNKNSDYTPVFDAFQGRIKAVVALGDTRDQILRDAKKTGYENIYLCDGDFEEAVDKAFELATDGDTVLLSPACASYDMFNNFEERGTIFKQMILEKV